MKEYDVAVIGGGPSGSTVSTLLKKYHPELQVAVFERETFPRDHVGESLLPPTGPILDEMGVWDRVEAADFPIKIGATLRWGKEHELWNFEFFPSSQFVDEPRPACFEGQRRLTSFQVDRSVFDKILLDRARELGVEVFETTKVAEVLTEGEMVKGIRLEGGEKVKARIYIDASGNSGILRRALDVPCTYPPSLRNIAVYDYWLNAQWAVKIGVGATRIQVRSLPYGWIWFIPLGPTRTSVGLVIPADYLKESGLTAAQAYRKALSEEEEVAALLVGASCEEQLTTTKDWSFVAERQVGPNWFLVGEAAGFADPILSAGVSMSMLGAQQAAYTILELDRGEEDPEWLKSEFDSRQRRRIQTHISFADYWYTVNSQFKDLKEFTARLAKENGLDLEPEAAWRWLAQGGFIDEDLTVGLGGFSMTGVKSSTKFLAPLAYDSPLEQCNVFKLDLEAAERKVIAKYSAGRVIRSGGYVRDGKTLPLAGHFVAIFNLLQRENRLPVIAEMLQHLHSKHRDEPEMLASLAQVPEALEGMVRDGWVKASYDPRLPLTKLDTRGMGFERNRDTGRNKVT